MDIYASGYLYLDKHTEDFASEQRLSLEGRKEDLLIPGSQQG